MLLLSLSYFRFIENVDITKAGVHLSMLIKRDGMVRTVELILFCGFKT